MRSSASHIGLATMLVALAGPVAAEEKPEAYYGYAIQVNVDWMMDLESATVQQVRPGSPAAGSGLVEGDQIVEIEGCAVPGCGAHKAQKLIQKPVGETVHLKLKHKDGTLYNANLVGVAAPAAITPAAAHQ